MDISGPAGRGMDEIAAAEKAREAQPGLSAINPAQIATPSPQLELSDKVDVRALEKRVRRKLDRVLIPLVFVAYLVAFLDRSNIGNADMAGMSKDLGLSKAEYQWLITIFYIPYILFEWLAIMWKLIPPHIWAAISIMIWGVASTLHAAAFDWSGLMACRWFLAMAETGFAPGVPYLLSFFYRRTDLGFRIGIFVSAAPLATTFSGALAYAITSGHPPIESWRLLFIVEGIPAFLIAGLVFFFLPDSPETARFLTPVERNVAQAQAIAQSGRAGADRLGAFDWREAAGALRSPATLIQPLMYFSCNVSFASLPVFLPAILGAMGYSGTDAQGLTAPPYLLAFAVCIGTTWIADRARQRGLVIAAVSVLGGVGYIVLATVHLTGARYAAVFLAAAGVFPAIANILPWLLNNQGTDAKRGAGIALLNVVGQCGPLLGTRMYPAREAPYYVTGMAVCAAFMFFNAFLALVLRAYFVRENARLEREEREMAVTVVIAGGQEERERAEDDMEARKVGVGTARKRMEPDELPEIEGSYGYRYML